MSSGITETLGERLVKALKDRNLTQNALGKRIGASQAAVSHWCKGNKEPTDSNLDAIATAIGINRDWLQHGMGQMRSIDLGAQRGEYMRDAYWGFRIGPKDRGRD